MTRDQYETQDPTEQHPQPDSEGEQLPHPGRTGEMRDEPDHGEESYRGTGKLTGRRAVITGGDSGIGRAVAIAFAREGADVLLAYLESEESDAKETVRWIEEAGRRGATCPGDLTSEEQCRRVVDTSVSQLGGIDILVNNAAYQMAQDGGIEDISTEQFDRVVRTNLYAMFWLCKKALPHMPSGATIVNTSSIQASQPHPRCWTTP